MDALCYASRAALLSTRIPKTVVEDVEGVMDFEVVDDLDQAYTLTDLHLLPICITTNKVINATKQVKLVDWIWFCFGCHRGRRKLYGCQADCCGE